MNPPPPGYTFRAGHVERRPVILETYSPESALRRKLERESERLRRQHALVETARREAYERGFREGVEHERRKSEDSIAHLHRLFERARSEAAEAQRVVGEAPTQAVETLPPETGAEAEQAWCPTGHWTANCDGRAQQRPGLEQGREGHEGTGAGPHATLT